MAISDEMGMHWLPLRSEMLVNPANVVTGTLGLSRSLLMVVYTSVVAVAEAAFFRRDCPFLFRSGHSGRWSGMEVLVLMS